MKVLSKKGKKTSADQIDKSLDKYSGKIISQQKAAAAKKHMNEAMDIFNRFKK